MPLAPKWKIPGTRVLTPIGSGALGSRLLHGKIEIVLDEPWAGEKTCFQSPGEIALDTDFTLLRIISLSNIVIVTSAVNYPTWKETQEMLGLAPYAEDETVIALNFTDKRAECFRLWNHIADYHQIEAGFDRHLHVLPWVSDSKKEAIETWERDITPLGGTAETLTLTVMLAFENDESRILARKVMATASILKDETYF